MKYPLLLGLLFQFTISMAQVPPSIIEVTPNIQLLPIGEQVYIHITYTNSENFGRYSSNGLLVVSNGDCLMIDTPESESDTQLLYNFIRDSLHATVSQFIGGHYHSDCIGGMPILKQHKVHTLLNKRTQSLCKAQNLALASETFDTLYQSKIGDISYECTYLGGGHTADNIVVFLPDQKLLFGGCLVKNGGARNMGNTIHAVPSEWAQTVEKVYQRYKEAEIVVPGHGAHGDIFLLEHTLQLAKKSFN